MTIFTLLTESSSVNKVNTVNQISNNGSPESVSRRCLLLSAFVILGYNTFLSGSVLFPFVSFPDDFDSCAVYT